MYGSSINTPEEFGEIIEYTISHLKSMDFDMIVFRGFSGAVVAPTVAFQLKKKWALVRKSHDTTHSDRHIEGIVKGKFVVIDDFIDSGETIRTILEEVYSQFPDAFCVGAFLYGEAWAKRVSIDGTIRDRYEEKLRGIPILNWQPPACEPLQRDNLKCSQQLTISQRMIIAGFDSCAPCVDDCIGLCSHVNCR